jgi:tripartite-type tricarboxylate transporter receptor subunit TctC
MKKRVSMKLVWLGLAVALAFGVTSTASAQPGEFVDGVLQPLADGFPKRAITIVNIDDPGAREGIYARMMQEAARGFSPVPILITDEPAPSFGTWYGMKEILKRDGGADGYYPFVQTAYGVFSDLHQEPIEKELGIKPSDMNAFIITESSTYMIFQRKNPPWGRTWADLVKYAKANPGKVRYISKDVGSGPDLVCHWIMQQVGIKVKQIPVGSNQERDSTVAAGEGDFTLSQAEGALTHAARLDVLMALGPKVPPPWDKDPNVISSVQAGLPAQPRGTSTGFAVPRQVPQEHVEWLFKLFKAAAETDLVKRREKAIPGTVVDVVGLEESNAICMKFYKDSESIVRLLGLHWDQKK